MEKKSFLGIKQEEKPLKAIHKSVIESLKQWEITR